MNRRSHILVTAVAALAASTVVSGADENLTQYDLATLMNMDVMVTSAARRAQRTEDAAAAVFVITREDIERSGAVTLPDLLRTVPGLQVARINTRTWAVTARGFNRQFANKLQVLVDGRSIYAMVFSGVMWEEQFAPLEQIERIEIVRGPGGALWGINAVNGVINIITRAPGDDQGLHASAGAGSAIAESSSAHYGFHGLGGDGHVYFDHESAEQFAGDCNDLDRSQIGASFERALGADRLAARINYAAADFGESHSVGNSILPPSASIGAATVGWRRELAGAETSATAYYAWSDRDNPGGWDEESMGLDVQHTSARIGRHVVTFGGGYRHVADDQGEETPVLAFSRTSLQYDQWSAYLQDEMFWLGDRVRLIAGAKLENYRYPGFELQPTLRALWRVNDQHTLWSAASRAARSPARFELHSQIDAPLPGGDLPMSISVSGNENLGSEHLNAYELGWRWRPHARFTLDATAFVNDYEHLIVEVQGPLEFVAGPPPHIVAPLVYENAASATGRGAELAMEYAPTSTWRLYASGHWLDLDLPVIANSLNVMGGDPQYAWSVRTRFDASSVLQLDATYRAVGEIETQNIPGYGSLDLHAGWRIGGGWSLSFSIENVLNDRHVEFHDDIALTPGVVVGRSALIRLAWRAAP